VTVLKLGDGAALPWAEQAGELSEGNAWRQMRRARSAHRGGCVWIAPITPLGIAHGHRDKRRAVQEATSPELTAN
jgi:hypothetical protein